MVPARRRLLATFQVTLLGLLFVGVVAPPLALAQPRADVAMEQSMGVAKVATAPDHCTWAFDQNGGHGEIVSFVAACDRHDACYALIKTVENIDQRESMRENCDAGFREDLNEVCDNQSTHPNACRRTAHLYWMAVRAFGPLF